MLMLYTVTVAHKYMLIKLPVSIYSPGKQIEVS